MAAMAFLKVLFNFSYLEKQLPRLRSCSKLFGQPFFHLLDLWLLIVSLDMALSENGLHVHRHVLPFR